MKILAIDTSTKACVLGLMLDGALYSHSEVISRAHSKEILPRIDQLLRSQGLKAKDLEVIIYGQGPGSFTGLRIGIGITQGLAFGLDIPVVGISTLACFAQASYRHQGAKNSLVALLARKEEVYFGAYKISAGIARPTDSERVVAARLIPGQDASLDWSGTGSAWHLQHLLEKATGVKVREVYVAHYPDAEDLILLGIDAFKAGNVMQAMQAQPKYLRDVVAGASKKQPRRAPEA